MDIGIDGKAYIKGWIYIILQYTLINLCFNNQISILEKRLKLIQSPIAKGYKLGYRAVIMVPKSSLMKAEAITKITIVPSSW